MDQTVSVKHKPKMSSFQMVMVGNIAWLHLSQELSASAPDAPLTIDESNGDVNA